MGLQTARPVLETIGDYDLLEKIAEGGMGSVYKARQRSTDTIVAMKILPPHLAKNAVLLKRFEQEYKSAKLLDHPNIVRALDFGYRGESPYLVMEFVEGESLGDRLERDRSIPEAEAIRLISQVAQGLHKAHKQGLIHRDVKPDNILITHDGQAKLTDLGLVKEMETDLNLTRTGRGLGTPHFMAPEQFRNAKNADARCDIYSLGATLYMMVTGELPFKLLGPLEAWMKKIKGDLPPARDLLPSLSERVDWAIRRAMSADPIQRPTNCREFIEDLTGHSTRRITPQGQPKPEIWYLRYKDEDGVSHMIKGPMAGIRRNLKNGLIGNPNHIRASRSKTGPFELLKNHPEFRDLVVTLTAGPLANLERKPSTSPLPGQTPSPQFRHDIPPTAAPPSKPAMSKPNPPPKSPPPDMELTPAPHIYLHNQQPVTDWGKVILFLLTIAAVVVAGYYFYPQIMAFLRGWGINLPS
jgi:serine/threonine protein kinase